MRTPSLSRRRMRAALIVALVGGILLVAIPFVGWLAAGGLPNEAQLDAMLDACQVTTVFEAGENRTARLVCPDAVAPSDFSEHLLSAVVASEDQRFLGHRGVDDLAVFRSALPGFSGGGSTITQQLARTLFLNDEPILGSQRTGKLMRKFREWHLSRSIETLRDKRQILTMYLNVAPLGNGIIGFDPAARYYFGKAARDLDVMEAAALVGMLPQPMRRQPFRGDMDQARRCADAADRIVDKMLGLGLITGREARDAHAKALRVLRKGRLVEPSHEKLIEALRPIEYRRVRDFADLRLEEIEIGAAATRVFVTMDPEMQSLADKAARSATKGAEMAAVVLGPDAEVLAISGGTYSKSSWNPAWRAERSIGSLAKPILYSIAIDRPGSMPGRWSTAPLKGYSPAEDRAKCPSGQALEEYLKHSCNVPFVTVAASEPALSTERVRSMGLRAPGNPLLIATGGVYSNPMTVAAAYTAFRNGGVLRQPHVLVAAMGAGGRMLAFETPSEGLRVLDAGTALSVRRALSKPTSEGGTGERAAGRKRSAKVWGKTGTSDGGRDAWFVGSTANWTAAILAYREAPGDGNMYGGVLPASRFGEMVDAYWPDRNAARMRDGRLRDGADPKVYGWWAHPKRLYNWLAAQAMAGTAVVLLAMSLWLMLGGRRRRKSQIVVPGDLPGGTVNL